MWWECCSLQVKGGTAGARALIETSSKASVGSRLILITFSPPSEPNNSFWNPTSNPDFPFNVVYIFYPYIIYFQVNTTEKKTLALISIYRRIKRNSISIIVTKCCHTGMIFQTYVCMSYVKSTQYHSKACNRHTGPLFPFRALLLQIVKWAHVQKLHYSRGW